MAQIDLYLLMGEVSYVVLKLSCASGVAKMAEFLEILDRFHMPLVVVSRHSLNGC
jgi:hypothetical protein